MNLTPGDWFHPDLAELHFIQSLPTDFSSEVLREKLVAIAEGLPAHPLRRRIFFPPEVINEHRIREWNLSRFAIVEAFESLQSRGIDLKKDGAKIRYSLSHTSGASVAICVLSGSSKGNFGVDIERRDREITNAAFARFSVKKEAAHLPDPLSQWVLKESCLKAHPKSESTFISQFEITTRIAGQEQFELVSATAKQEKFQALLIAHEDFLIGVARGVRP